MDNELKPYEVKLQWLKEQGLEGKYEKPGIYCIYIEDKLVYIGQSKNMLVRLANHLVEIETNQKTHKYIIIREAWQKGLNVRFDVMEYCDKECLGDKEATYIQRLMPPLNYQIPKIGEPGYYTNRNANTITLQEILNPVLQF